jgi:hypothetical protein
MPYIYTSGISNKCWATILAAILPNRDKYMFVKNGRKLILYALINREYHFKFILKKIGKDIVKTEQHNEDTENSIRLYNCSINN